MVKDYKLLGQSERDGYIVRPPPSSSTSCWLVGLGGLVVVLIVGGLLAFLGGLFYTGGPQGLLRLFYPVGGNETVETTTWATTTTTLNISFVTTWTPENSTAVNGTSTEPTDQIFEEKFAQAMRKTVDYLKSITGIERSELVVPLFMLVCFLSFLAAISLCCCIVMKRRDTRRRKILGKIITDLQTGDSKVLLNDDGDD